MLLEMPAELEASREAADGPSPVGTVFIGGSLRGHRGRLRGPFLAAGWRGGSAPKDGSQFGHVCGPGQCMSRFWKIPLLLLFAML